MPVESNSSYFSDNDIARTHLVCTLFAKGIEKIRGGTSALIDGKASPFAFALGAVSCSFRKEIKPYEQYEMWTRVLTWDEKWLYVVTHFVRKDAATPNGISLYPSQQTAALDKRQAVTVDGLLTEDGKNKPIVYASALSKCVFKKGRITIAPIVMLEAAGLLPPRNEPVSTWRDDSVLDSFESHNSSNDAAVKNTQFVEPDSPHDFTDNSTNFTSDDTLEGASRRTSADCTHEAIEIERLRGLEVAKHLAQQAALESHFNSDTDALGRHRDGTGLTGVVTTLAQLGKISRTQFL